MNRHLKISLASLMLVGALALPLACSFTSEKQAEIVHVQGQLDNALEELVAAQAALSAALAAPAGTKTDEEMAALQATVQATVTTVTALGTALKTALTELPDSWKKDFDAFKAGGAGDNLIGGVLSIGGAQGGLIGIASTMILGWWRDRRKRKGMDPLQLASVATPPTNTGPTG